MASHLSEASNHRAFDHILRNGGRYHFPISRRAFHFGQLLRSRSKSERIEILFQTPHALLGERGEL